MNPEKSLICIPDITGFTEFVKESEMELSTRVIPSLLNEIIYTNTLKLKVSEIEGDAVLFYRLGDPPASEELLKQCEYFHQQFHKKIIELEKRFDSFSYSGLLRKNLGLKIVAHYGEVILMEVGKHIKLMGEDVITAHRLLKNSIPDKEYLLFSESLCSKYSEQNTTCLDKKGVKKSSDEYQHLGNVSYRYIPL